MVHVWGAHAGGGMRAETSWCGRITCAEDELSCPDPGTHDHATLCVPSLHATVLQDARHGEVPQMTASTRAPPSLP